MPKRSHSLPLLAGILLMLAACSPADGEPLAADATSTVTSGTLPAPVGVDTPAAALPASPATTATPLPRPTATPFPFDLPDMGLAPEISNDVWLNSDGPVTLASLRGKVVLIEFWTFG